MRNKFDKELENLNTELIEMGSLIENAIEQAVYALINKDAKKAYEIMHNDNEIDNKERAIERLCLKLLLQQQPVAKDLRLISTAIKMIADMERIGDQAADISEITIYIVNHHSSFLDIDFKDMAYATIDMVNKSIDAFVNRDQQLAEKVISLDDIVDNYFNTIKSTLIDIVRNEPKMSEQIVDFLMVAKYFERIGDHAVNIAEWVIFSITGEHKNQRII